MGNQPEVVYRYLKVSFSRLSLSLGTSVVKAVRALFEAKISSLLAANQAGGVHQDLQQLAGTAHPQSDPEDAARVLYEVSSA